MCGPILSTTSSVSLIVSWSFFLLQGVDTHRSALLCELSSGGNKKNAYVATCSGCREEEGAYVATCLGCGDERGACSTRSIDTVYGLPLSSTVIVFL